MPMVLAIGKPPSSMSWLRTADDAAKKLNGAKLDRNHAWESMAGGTNCLVRR